jgi:hypothetical protein
MMKQAAGFLHKRTFWRFIVNPDWSLVGKYVSRKMERISDATFVKRITLASQHLTHTGKKNILIWALLNLLIVRRVQKASKHPEV